MSRYYVPERQHRRTWVRTPRVATLGVAAAAMTAPVALAPSASATPVGHLPQTPQLPTTPLPTTPDLGATPILPATPTSQTMVVTTGANVRSGPGTGYRIVGGLSAGSRVTGTMSNGWFKMGNGRYVSGSLLRPAGSENPRTGDSYRVDVGANVRSGPGTGYRIVGGLSAGSTVTGTMSNGWLNMGNGRYVYGNLLTRVGSDPAPGPDPAPDPPAGESTMRVTVGSNVRSGPGTNYRIVGGLSAGTEVTGSMTSNGWFNMGNNRYVSGTLLEPVDGSTPPSNEVVRWTTTNVNVRSGPGTQHSIVGSVSRGSRVTGTLTTNNWLDMGNGRFVSGTLLTGDDPSNPGPDPQPGEVTGQMVLTEVAKYNGVPYVWGGTTPAGFDCSGLTQYTLAQLGISLPRTAAQQQAYTTTTTNPRPGDLVFFGYPAYHVGVYAGDGMLWDAGRPGVPVQKRAIWNSNDISYGKIPGVST